MKEREGGMENALFINCMVTINILIGGRFGETLQYEKQEIVFLNIKEWFHADEQLMHMLCQTKITIP